MRMQAVLTQALGETGTATGRHLPRLFAVQAFNAGRRRHGHAKAQDRVVPMRPSSARQRAAVAAQCRSDNGKRWAANTQYHWVPTCVGLAPRGLLRSATDAIKREGFARLTAGVPRAETTLHEHIAQASRHLLYASTHRAESSSASILAE